VSFQLSFAVVSGGFYLWEHRANNHRSGELNAKHRELLELQALAQRRLAGVRTNFADGMKAAKEVQRDLQWTQKRVE
jgi:hypothetical protein